MKMTFATGMIFVLIICFTGVPAFGMNCHVQNDKAHSGHNAAGEKLQWDGMSKHMIPMMKTLSGMTQNLAEAMATGMDDHKMGTLAGLMDEVSTHMVRMFDIMNSKSATEGEMHALHMNINETETKIKQMR